MTDLPSRASRLGAPSRRVVIGAAWTAPVIVAAAIAPAHAASAAASLAVDTFVAYGAAYDMSGAPTRIETKAQLRRLWSDTTPVVRSVTISVAFPATAAAGGAARSVTGAGWAAGPVTGTSTAHTYTFTWTGRLDNASQATSELLFHIDRRSGSMRNTSLTLYATSPQATPTQATTTATI